MTQTFSSPKYPEVMTAVYRLYDDGGALLYVGVAEDFDARFRQHAYHKAWWPQVARKDVTWFPTRLDALYEERRAIRHEAPTHNTSRCIHPFAVVIVKRTREPFYSYEPRKGEIIVDKDTIRDVVEEVARRGTHALLLDEGEPVGVMVPLEWAQRAAERMGEPFDIDKKPRFAAERLYAKPSQLARLPDDVAA